MNRSALHIRPFEPADLPALTAISNEQFPDDPMTVAEREHREQNRDPNLPFKHLVAMLDDQIVASGNCGIGRSGMPRFHLWIVVRRDLTRQGIGRHLAGLLVDWARQQRQPLLRSWCSEDKTGAVAFLEALGFSQIGKRFESELDLATFDANLFNHAYERAAAAGITFNTFDQETAPDARERLFRLARPLFLSVPFPGGEPFDLSYNEFVKETLDHPLAGADQTVVAKQGERYVGYSSIWLPEQRPAVTIMTGVAPEARRHGVGLALKLETIRIARARGAQRMTTMNDTANPGILALNQKLGYRARPALLAWEKPLTAHAEA